MIEVDIQTVSIEPGIPADADMRRWVSAALNGRRTEAELAVRIVDEPEGRAFNATYRGRDYPTNVLSFPVELPDGVDLAILGDLVVCAPVVAREATAQGKSIAAHWAHMIVHGVLHLLGHDHVEDDQAETMESLERAVLSTLGYADPYATEAVIPESERDERGSIG